MSWMVPKISSPNAFIPIRPGRQTRDGPVVRKVGRHRLVDDANIGLVVELLLEPSHGSRVAHRVVPPFVATSS